MSPSKAKKLIVYMNRRWQLGFLFLVSGTWCNETRQKSTVFRQMTAESFQNFNFTCTPGRDCLRLVEFAHSFHASDMDALLTRPSQANGSGRGYPDHIAVNGSVRFGLSSCLFYIRASVTLLRQLKAGTAH